MITNMQPLRMESVLHVANERFGQSPTNISSGRSSSIKFFCVNYMIFNFHSVSLFTKVKLIVKKRVERWFYPHLVIKALLIALKFVERHAHFVVADTIIFSYYCLYGLRQGLPRSLSSCNV